MTGIIECGMSNCVYNKNRLCHTPAITVSAHAECGTYSHASAKGGFEEVNGGVGACLTSDCRFNHQLECSAPEISVVAHDRHADCRTFECRE